jgi:hypothetical protein
VGFPGGFHGAGREVVVGSHVDEGTGGGGGGTAHGGATDVVGLYVEVGGGRVGVFLGVVGGGCVRVVVGCGLVAHGGAPLTVVVCQMVCGPFHPGLFGGGPLSVIVTILTIVLYDVTGLGE